jgi:beta-galactosidase
MEKVASASFIWINGNEVGYNEGAQEPAEYNITKFLKPGKNTIAVHVVKYSDGYYLEGQDYWRLAGIFDDVLLYATPKTRLFDWQITTDLDSDYKNADLKIAVHIKKYSNSPKESFSVKAILKDAQQNKLQEISSELKNISDENKLQFQLEKLIENPKKWTAETPDLYTLELQLLNENAKIIDKATNQIGFKETEIRGAVFYLNGKPIKVNAQNSHMQHPEDGHVINEETIRRDFEILKQFNFNAVRTSHYPPVNAYLRLANEYGLYIIDETGDEAHASEYVSDYPTFTEMYKERVQKMVLRDRNYPCVLFWSAGNESGEGFNIAEVITEGKKLDPTRSWMYGGNAFAHDAEDIIGPRYPTPLELETVIGLTSDQKNARPSFMDEYLSVAGNGGGGLDEYWNVIYQYPRIMGGAIWDFVSPGLKEKTISIVDSSPHKVMANIMGDAKLVQNEKEKALDLNGHDQWIEVYRDKILETETNKLTLACKVFPRKLVSSSGSFITKGSYQYGLQQQGKDSLEFYVYTDKKNSIQAKLPENWEYNWHQVTVNYDGVSMHIYLNGKLAASGKATGNIRNFPYPVNIGRNAEIHGQETNVHICDAKLDEVAIFMDVVRAEELLEENAKNLAKKAALWLDFEEEKVSGNFYSYGIGARTYGSIWPDRTIQPEMWQMKKTTQPIAIKLVDAENGIVEVLNRHYFKNTDGYQTKWFLEEDGKIIQKGDLNLSLEPQEKKQIQITYRKPKIEPGKEYFLTISSSIKTDKIWSKSRHEVAWDQFELDWYQILEKEIKDVNNEMQVVENVEKAIVKNSDFTYTFDKNEGALVSINSFGKELLKDGIRLNVWRAPLANEQDAWNSYTIDTKNWKEGFGRQIAAEYYSVGLDILNSKTTFFNIVQEEGKVVIEIHTIDLFEKKDLDKNNQYTSGIATEGFKNKYLYHIANSGEITMQHTVTPQGKMPFWLPRVGVEMALNEDLNNVKWFGRGPQENYPDRKTGYKIGVYETTVEKMYEPYLLPQDYGLRTENRYVEMTDKNGAGLRFSSTDLFNFNAYPFATENLTKAMYTYQLQKQEAITFNLDYATSGVGDTARGILNEYAVQPEQFVREIRITPLKSKK